MWRVRRAHRPQAVAGEVVGREGVEALEVVEVVVGLGLRLRLYAIRRMSMSQVTSTSNTSNSY